MHVLIVDDDETLRELLASELRRLGHKISLAATAAEGLKRVEAEEPDLLLLDLMLPDRLGLDVLRQLRSERPALEVVVLTAHGTVDTAVEAMKLGAFDYLRKPCSLDEVEITLGRAYERRRLSEDNARLRDGIGAPSLDAHFVGSGPWFEELRRFIVKVAASDSAVLIRGETGTGKELLAQAIHRQSARAPQPFVAVDCAALQESLLQSELFGHEKGAFTGAVKQKYGLFEVADGGTIFLDEVGDLSPSVQARLLRALETSSFRRLGGTREIKVNVRLLAATNRNLERMTASEQFRWDLFYRLNTIHVELPPLRERQDDIASLAEHFIARWNARHQTRKSIASKAMACLRAYRWPGNVRELRHVVERALVLADGNTVGIADLPPEVHAVPSLTTSATHALPLAELERRHISRVLHDVSGHRARAAEILGISERTLYRKLGELEMEAGIEPPDASGDE